MQIGDLVIIRCANEMLNGKMGTVMLHKEFRGGVYGLCVLIDGQVYGFQDHEVELIDESR